MCCRSMHADTFSIAGQPVVHRRFPVALVPVLIRSGGWGGGGHNVGTPFTTHALLCYTHTARQNDRADRHRGIVYIDCRPPFTVSMSSCCHKRVRSCGDSLTHTHGAPRSSLRAPRGTWGAPSGFFWLDPPGTLWNPPWCTSAPLSWPRWRPALSPTSPVCDRRTGAPQCHATVTTARS